MDQLCLFYLCFCKQNYVIYDTRDWRFLVLYSHALFPPGILPQWDKTTVPYMRQKMYGERGFPWCIRRYIPLVGWNHLVGSLLHKKFREQEEIQFIITCIILVRKESTQTQGGWIVLYGFCTFLVNRLRPCLQMVFLNWPEVEFLRKWAIEIMDMGFLRGKASSPTEVKKPRPTSCKIFINFTIRAKTLQCNTPCYNLQHT